MNGDGLTDAWLAVGTASSDLAAARRRQFRRAPRVSRPARREPADDRRHAVADMNGNGTADIVWNDSPAPRPTGLELPGSDRRRPPPPADDDRKRTRVARSRFDTARPGAMFRMAAAAGQPWTTRLPIATQVVGTVTTSDGRGWSKQEAFVYGTATSTPPPGSSAVSARRRGSSPATTRRRRRFRFIVSTSAPRPRRSKASSSASRCRPPNGASSSARHRPTRSATTEPASTAGA